jgi:hypothetical protein
LKTELWGSALAGEEKCRGEEAVTRYIVIIIIIIIIIII